MLDSSDPKLVEVHRRALIDLSEFPVSSVIRDDVLSLHAGYLGNCIDTLFSFFQTYCLCVRGNKWVLFQGFEKGRK